jgi:hypothetical protein
MKEINPIERNTTSKPGLRTVCLASCRRILAQVKNARAAILNEFRSSLEAHDHLLHLALNEAEALAWQSGVPHLVFPTLAREKAQHVAAWHKRQRSLQRSDMAFTH